MTALEKAVANALRLSDDAALKLLDTIQLNIETARAELIRSGVSEEVVNAEDALVKTAIITFCLMQMDDTDMLERYQAAFQYQQDNLRKS